MDEMKARLEKAEPMERNRITVLLAPTWGPEGILSKYGDSIIDELIKTGYDLIIRPHPQSFVSETELLDRLMGKYPETDVLKWNRDSDNFDVLRKADIMISDFSGVLFDYTLVYDKPVVYTATEIDKSLYDAWWLGGKTWTEKVLPELGKELKFEDIPMLKDIIDECLNNESYSEGRESVRSQCWDSMGKGSVKVVDYLLSKMEELDK